MRRVVPPAMILAPLALAIAACGQRADLKPQAGHTLPPAPYGRDDRSSAEALMKPTPQAAPERSVELRKRSEERSQDPFDLPPSD
ncbi:MAG: hypothetical protein RLZZ84_682 [Pseudomonadota bacterium]|jgi:predicted small lipoprotein YifL